MKTAISMQVAHLIAQLLIAGNLFTLLVGVLMLVAPQRLASMFKVSDRWVSTKRAFEPLDMVHDTDNIALRYPRVLGAALVLGAAFILIRGGVFAASLSAAEGGRLLAQIFGAGKIPHAAWEVLWLNLVAVVLLGALMALALGVLSLYRKKEILQRLFGLANRWVATHHVFDQLDKPHYGFNKIIHEKSQVWGACITVFSLCAIFLLIWYLRH
ncbi:MAG: hypothetical protein HY082_07385 [Gammaproteobacteria bacterium]|nr:hypothetical protein [Gammaproteobacteria bacterium]